jgi:hypothetical protein
MFFDIYRLVEPTEINPCVIGARYVIIDPIREVVWLYEW